MSTVPLEVLVDDGLLSNMMCHMTSGQLTDALSAICRHTSTPPENWSVGSHW